jgi:hypothetical protein
MNSGTTVNILRKIRVACFRTDLPVSDHSWQLKNSPLNLCPLAPIQQSCNLSSGARDNSQRIRFLVRKHSLVRGAKCPGDIIE